MLLRIAVRACANSRNQNGRNRADEFTLLEHDPEKHALGLDPWVDFRFSEKIMLQPEI